MAFSLVGFGAGLAESVTERIEEERKFSNLALQGRIERASVLKQQRDKESAALETELREKKTMLEGWGVQDPDLQKAYLSNPAAFNALQEVNKPGSQIRVDPKDLILSPDKEKLGTMSTDDYITQAVKRLRGPVAPAKLLETPGRGMLAPSAGTEQRRFEQLAGMRGMTLEDVARAEDTTPIQRPPVAAALNFEKLRRPEKEDVDDTLKRLLKNAADAASKFGKGDRRTVEAEMQYNAYQAYVTDMRQNDPSKQTHSELLQRYQAMLYSSNSKATPEQKEEARAYIDNYNRDKNRLEKLGKPNDKMPTENVMSNGMTARAANAVMLKYGDRVNKGFAEQRIQTGPTENDYIIDLRVTEGDATLRAEVLLLRQKAAMSHPEVIAEMAANNGLVKNTTVRNALSRFGIDFSKDGAPILVNEQGSSLKVNDGSPPPQSTTGSTPQRQPVVGKQTGRTVVPGPAPAPIPVTQAVNATAQKIMTRADVAATARSRGISEEEVIKAAQAKGYTIQ